MEDKIREIAIIGTGIMGSGIAQVFAQSGYHVTIYDLSANNIRRCRVRIESNQKIMIAKGLLSEEEAALVCSRINDTADLHKAAKDADLIIEAVPEIMELKKEIFSKLDHFSSENTILASNTSGLSITEIASYTQNPEKVIGINWWNPPYIIPLVEIIKGEKTSEDTVKRVLTISQKIGKRPVVVKKTSPGFIGNRIQFAMLREALHILEEGIASAEDIDTAVKAGLGFRLPVVGPLEAADFGGLDTFLQISGYLLKHISNSVNPADILKQHVKKNELGIKTGKGIYDYSGKSIKQLIQKRDEQFMDILRCIEHSNRKETGC